jgi:hypothetical protein
MVEVSMAFRSIWCPVLQGYVARVTDPAGCVAAVFCCEFDRPTRTCRMKREAVRYGAFSPLMAAQSDNPVVDLFTRCGMS